MAQPADSLTFNDLLNVKTGGVVKEEVYQEIQNLGMRIPTEFFNRVNKTSVQSHKFDWLEDDEPAAADTSVAEASDLSFSTPASGLRKVNYTQINARASNFSYRSDVLAVHGRGSSVAYETAKQLRGLRYDIETAILDGLNASVQDNNNNAKGRTAPLAVQIETNVVRNGATGGGYNSTTGLFNAISAGTSGPVALDWDDVRDVLEGIYENGGNASIMMCTPGVARVTNEYLVKSPYYVPPTSNTSADNRSGVGLTAKGFFAAFVDDFGNVITIVPNRRQLGYAAPTGTAATTASHVFFLDMATIDLVYLEGITTKPAESTDGLYFKRKYYADWGLRVNAEAANGVIMQVSSTSPVTDSTQAGS